VILLFIKMVNFSFFSMFHVKLIIVTFFYKLILVFIIYFVIMFLRLFEPEKEGVK